MTESIESFVAKLQSAGVQAGKEQAEKFLAEAHANAGKITEQATAKGEKIIAAARTEADDILARAKTEMQLAVRDDLLRLREAMIHTTEAVLARAAEQKLVEEDFLGKILHDLILQYAKADSEGQNTMEINVPAEMRQKLCDWALNEMTRKADRAGISIDLHGSLKRAGFEYSFDGANVEITADSVVQTLSDLVGPELLETIRQATKD